jgi:hypothetical protein
VGAAAYAHRILVEMLVGLIAQVRGDRERLNAATAAQIRAYCSELAMTPAARVRLEAGRPRSL